MRGLSGGSGHTMSCFEPARCEPAQPESRQRGRPGERDGPERRRGIGGELRRMCASSLGARRWNTGDERFIPAVGTPGQAGEDARSRQYDVVSWPCDLGVARHSPVPWQLSAQLPSPGRDAQVRAPARPRRASRSTTRSSMRWRVPVRRCPRAPRRRGRRGRPSRARSAPPREAGGGSGSRRGRRSDRRTAPPDRGTCSRARTTAALSSVGSEVRYCAPAATGTSSRAVRAAPPPPAPGPSSDAWQSLQYTWEPVVYGGFRLGTTGFLAGAATGWNEGDPGSNTRRRFVSSTDAPHRGAPRDPLGCGLFALSPWHFRQISYSIGAGSTRRPPRSMPHAPASGPETAGAVAPPLRADAGRGSRRTRRAGPRRGTSGTRRCPLPPSPASCVPRPTEACANGFASSAPMYRRVTGVAWQRRQGVVVPLRPRHELPPGVRPVARVARHAARLADRGPAGGVPLAPSEARARGRVARAGRLDRHRVVAGEAERGPVARLHQELPDARIAVLGVGVVAGGALELAGGVEAARRRRGRGRGCRCQGPGRTRPGGCAGDRSPGSRGGRTGSSSKVVVIFFPVRV